nr:hypothetical protein [Tanacetum cinerariifolium]
MHANGSGNRVRHGSKLVKWDNIAVLEDKGNHSKIENQITFDYSSIKSQTSARFSNSRLDGKRPGKELVEYINTLSWNRHAFYKNDEDDDEEFSILMSEIHKSSLAAITPDLPKTDSLIMVDKHLDTIPEMKSDEFIKSSIENLVQNPSESEDECECDVPDCDDSQTTNFSTFSNPLFDDSTSSDDESSHEEVIHEMGFKTYLNPLFDLDEEIISSEFNPIHNEDLDSTLKNDRFDTKSYLLELLLNHDTLMASSPKFDSLLEEFSSELAYTNLIPPGINEANYDPKEDIHLVERLLYDNSSPRPSEEYNSENSDAIIESFSPSPIPVEGSGPFMEEIDLFLAFDGSIPPVLIVTTQPPKGIIFFQKD